MLGGRVWKDGEDREKDLLCHIQSRRSIPCILQFSRPLYIVLASIIIVILG
jgi:hypothetical protein